MTETIILTPKRAAETVCHEEQLRIWANDLVGLLSMENYLRADLDYSDGVDLERIVMRELGTGRNPPLRKSKPATLQSVLILFTIRRRRNRWTIPRPMLPLFRLTS